MKNRILHAVAENISLFGLKKFNLDVISSELKISKKTIYKYFSNKDEIVEEYFREILTTDKESTLNILKEDISINEKFHKIIYSYHKYKLPASVIEEAKLYYPDNWKQVIELKEFKVRTIINLLKEAKENDYIKEDIDLTIVALVIEKLSNELLDSDVLKENKLKINYAADQILQIILNGILI